jgi:beta-galactosidase
MLPEDKEGTILMDNKIYNWNNWADVVEPLEGTETLATYNSMYYKDKVAATFRKSGKGSVSFIGPDTDNAKFEKEVLKTVYSKVNVPVTELPEGLMLDWRDGFWVAINYNSDKTIEVPIPEKAIIHIGKKFLKPAEVVVWSEK